MNSTVHIELSEEETNEFRSMSRKEQKSFMETANKRREQLMLKTAVLCSLLVESFDALEYFKMTRYKTKQSVNNAKKHLEKYIDDVYGNNKNESDSTDYIAQKSKEIDKIL